MRERIIVADRVKFYVPEYCKVIGIVCETKSDYKVILKEWKQ